MIYFGGFISFVCPIIWCFVALDGENKFSKWVQSHPAVTTWFARICAILGSVLMAIGGMLEHGWSGILIPILTYLAVFLIYFIIRHIEKTRGSKT